MRRMLIGTMLVLGSMVSVFAQNKVIAVSGRVAEEESKQPIEQATIQLLHLPDSTYAAGVATDKQGRFTLTKLKAGKYALKVSYIGFKTKTIAVSLQPSTLPKSVGTVALASDAVMLKEAVITAEAPPVTVKADTTEYSAAAYPVPEGSMLEDLVKKIPGAKVDENGKITLNGKEIKKIMVDGKEFFSDDPKMSMKNIPVNMIEKVKAYDKKSDMARITGIDDGEEEAVLDLSVKKGMKKGWIGNLIAGYGSEERYEGGAMISRFKDDSSISVIASVNNTNNKGFSEFGDAGQGMGGNAGAGLSKAQSVGLNFAKDTEKIEVGGNVQYGHSINDAERKTSTETFLGDKSSFEKSVNRSNRDRHDLRADFRLEWRPDTLTTFIFRPSASYSNTEAISALNSQTENTGHNLINKKEVSSSSKSHNWSFDGRLMMFRRLNNKGRNIFAGAKFGYSDSESDIFSNSLGTFYKELEEDSVSQVSRYTDRAGDSRNWSVSASYTEPVFKNHFLQLRYEFAHRKQFSQSLVYDSLHVYPYPDYLERGYNNDLSTRVENFYDTHALNLSLRGIYTKLMYSVGMGLTPQSSLSQTTIGPNAAPDKNFPTQHVLNWAPMVMFRYQFSKQETLMFRYRGRSSTPNIEDLQEVIDNTDPMNLRFGNPNLKPSFNNSFMLFYNKFVPNSMQSYSANVFYSNTLNSVANRLVYDVETGARKYYKENVNGNWNARGYFSFNTPLKNQKFTLSSNTNLGYSDAVSYTTLSKETEAVLSTTHHLTAGQRLSGAYRSDLFDLSINGGVDYNAVRNSKQVNSNRETFDYYVGGNSNLNLPWSVSLSSEVSCRFKEGYSSGLNKNEVIWNAQLSKNFLKNNAATLRFKIYDLLKQQSNLTRTVSEIMMSDTEYNTLGSYFMVHFVYRFNTLGGKRGGGSDRSRERSRRPGSMGGYGRYHMH